jgi:hypothetical protein
MRHVTFTKTSAPYAVARFPSSPIPPSRITALTTPEPATATKHQSAIEEKRPTTVARCGPSAERSTTTARSPPIHSDAATR